MEIVSVPIYMVIFPSVRFKYQMVISSLGDALRGVCSRGFPDLNVESRWLAISRAKGMLVSSLSFCQRTCREQMKWNLAVLWCWLVVGYLFHHMSSNVYLLYYHMILSYVNLYYMFIILCV